MPDAIIRLMRRGWISVLAISCLLSLAAPLLADENKGIERRLKATYEGEAVKLQALPKPGEIRLDTPRRVQPIDPDAPAYLLIEKFSLKKRSLVLQTHRIYFYQTAQGKVRGIRSRTGKKYKLRWRGRQPNERRLEEVLEKAFPLMLDNPADWTGYWPPPRPKGYAAKSSHQQPSKEIAPGVFTVGKDVTPPSCELCPSPRYPAQLKAERVQGTVELDTTISKSGRVRGIRVAKTAGHELFDQAAVMTASHWRFKPTVRNGKPIRVFMVVEVNFRLF